MRGAILFLISGVAGCSAAPKTEVVESPQVRIAQIAATTAPDTVIGVGTVALHRETSLGFTSAGRIVRLAVNNGDTVRAGQLLAALDVTTTGADLSAARAERDRAAAEYKRTSALLADGWVTRPRVESAKAALEAAEARVRSAGFQTSNAVIMAPGHGTILARLAEPGQVVDAGVPVLVLGERSSGYVLRLLVADRDVARLHVGARATVRLAAIDGALAGRVREIGGRADRATGSFMVEIALPDDPRLRSGQIGEAVTVATAGSVTTLAVPANAVFAPRSGAAFVYVYDEAARRVRLRRVAIADATDADIRVTGGLRAGEWVATSRIDRLADDMPVQALRRTP